MAIFKEKLVPRVEVYKLLESELERYSLIFEKDKKEGFKNKRFETTIQLHIENLLDLIEELETEE